MNEKRGNGGLIFPIIAVLVIISMGFFMWNRSNGLENNPKYYEIINLYQQDQIEESTFEFTTGNLEYALKEDPSKKHSYRVPSVKLFVKAIDKIIFEKYEGDLENSKKIINYVHGTDYSWIHSVVPIVLLILMIGGLLLFMFKFSGSDIGKIGKFTKNNFKYCAERGRKTTFNQVAGADEEKEELTEIVEFLKNPKKFRDIGARVPKGCCWGGKRSVFFNFRFGFCRNVCWTWSVKSPGSV